MNVQFKKAVKYDARGRIALVGPAGAGKSWTMLTLARVLAGPEGTIAAVDTEHGSLSKYSDVAEFGGFDVIEPDEFSPDLFLKALDAAEAGGYSVFCCDSLSHFWMGRGGALEFVDMAAKRHKDQMGGWKDFRPHERLMVDRMIASPCHIIVTMRTKTDYQEVTENGKKKRVKVGLAPVQREGLEYEFDLVGYMDEDNTLIVDKTRCAALNQKALVKPGPATFAPFVDWLKGVKKEPPAKPDLAPLLKAIAEAADMDALKRAFYAANTAVGKDEAASVQIIAAKDKRKSELSLTNPRGEETARLAEIERHYVAIVAITNEDIEEKPMGRKIREYIEENLKDEPLYIGVADRLNAANIISAANLKVIMSGASSREAA